MKSLFGSRNSKPRDVAQKLIAAADQHRDAGRWVSAQEMYSLALNADPLLSDIWVQYGHALKESGDPTSALAAYKKALSIDPSVADTALQIGHCMKVLGDINACKEWYTKALELDPLDTRAEMELRSFGLSAEALVPNIERRRAVRRTYSSKGRHIFVCTLSHDYPTCREVLFRSKLFERELLGADTTDVYSLCTLTSQNELKLVSACGGSLPRGSIVIFPIDMFFDISGLNALINEAAIINCIIPVLLVDKIIGRRSAQGYLSDREDLYRNARTSCLLTITIDSTSIDYLDGATSVGSIVASPVIEIAKPLQAVSRHRNLGGRTVIIAENICDPDLPLIVALIRRESPSEPIIICERLDILQPFAWFPEEILSAYSVEGMAAIKDAALVLIMESSADTHRWITYGLANDAVIVTGLLENAFKVWGLAISDSVDFSNKKSLERLANLLRNNVGPKHESTSVPAYDAPKLQLDWDKLSELTWVGSNGLLPLKVGLRYSFGNSGVRKLSSNHSAERFIFGRSWLACNNDPNSTLQQWTLAAGYDGQNREPPSLRILLQNNSQSIERVRWTSTEGDESYYLKPGQRFWINVQADEILVEENAGILFNWIANGSAVQPLGFVAVSLDQMASWSGYLDRLDREWF